jgi:Zn-dependent alcohol dehydrogenase
VVFEVVGSADTIHQAVDISRRGGQVILVGLPSLDVTIQLPAMLGVILQERTVKGCWHGSSNLRRDIPRIVELYRSGQLRLDELVSRRIDLTQVNEALGAMAAGEVARSVIVY